MNFLSTKVNRFVELYGEITFDADRTILLPHSSTAAFLYV